MIMSIILIVMMSLQVCVCVYVNIIKTYTLNMCSLLYVNYT